jgi:hypothetical protein
MNYNQLLKKLPKTPAQSLYDSDGKEPTVEGIYLTQKFKSGFGYDTHVYFFNTPDEFVDFLPALIFFDEAMGDEDDFEEEEEEEDDDDNDEDEDEDEENSIGMNYQDDYENYLDLMTIKSFDDNKIYDLEGVSFGEMEILGVGKISDLLHISEESFNKTFDDLLDENEIQELGFTWTEYKILNGYFQEFNELPSKNQKQFFTFLKDFYLEWF